jgi:hypothetical protein
VTELAGYWLVAVGVLHVLYGLRWVDRGGFRRTVPPPWEREDVWLQRDFWSHVGSFAVPLGLLGGLLAWIGHRGSEPPLWLGVVLLAWVAAAIARAPRGGFWLAVAPALLLIVDSL